MAAGPPLYGLRVLVRSRAAAAEVPSHLNRLLTRPLCCSPCLRVYLLPPCTCPWVGLGYVGCDGSFECRAWVSTRTRLLWRACMQAAVPACKLRAPSCRAIQQRRQVCHLADKNRRYREQSARNPSLPSLATISRSRPLQINGDFWGVPQAIAHELGHNMFLGHSSAYNPDGSLDE